MSMQPNVVPSAANPGMQPVSEAPAVPGPAANRGPSQSGLGPDIQATIGRQLRMVYHEVLSEPIPDRFVRLLEELAKKEGGRE